MKLLFLINKLHPFGGAEMQMLNDANELCKHHEVSLITFEEDKLGQKISDKINYVKLDKMSYWKAGKEIAKFVKEHEVQLIHSHLFGANIIAILCSLFCNVKVVWNFHGHMYDAGLKEKVVLRFMSKMPALRKIFFVCSELIDYYRNDGYGLPAHLSHVVFNSSKLSEIEVKKDFQEKLTIGYVGRLVSLKRVHYLLELAAFLKTKGVNSFQIMILGDGAEREKLEALSASLDVEDCVRFMGFQSGLLDYYAKFDLFVLPSEEEALSLSLIDAGMFAIPSLAFNVGGNSDIIKSGETGFIVASKEELFEKALELVESRDRREEFGLAAREYCIEHFGKKEHIAILEKHYREAIGR